MCKCFKTHLHLREGIKSISIWKWMKFGCCCCCFFFTFTVVRLYCVCVCVHGGHAQKRWIYILNAKKLVHFCSQVQIVFLFCGFMVQILLNVWFLLMYCITFDFQLYCVCFFSLLLQPMNKCKQNRRRNNKNRHMLTNIRNGTGKLKKTATTANKQTKNK